MDKPTDKDLEAALEEMENEGGKMSCPIPHNTPMWPHHLPDGRMILKVEKPENTPHPKAPYLHYCPDWEIKKEPAVSGSTRKEPNV